MGLGSVVSKAMAGSGSLKKLINERFVSERIKLPLLHGGALRASEFGDMCPREEVLVSLAKLVRKHPRDASLLMIFLHGTALHWALQNHLLPDIGVLVGRWTCLDCGAAYGDGSDIPTSLVPKPSACACGSKDFNYRELELSNEEYRIGGHPDGFLVIPGLPGVGVVEAKSIGKGWEVKQCPILAHAIQAQIYMWFTGLKWAKIIYWEKGANGLDALIEHHLDRDEETILKIKQAIKAIWAALEDGGPLPERLCVSASAPRAKKCCVADPCFDQHVPSDNHAF